MFLWDCDFFFKMFFDSFFRGFVNEFCESARISFDNCNLDAYIYYVPGLLSFWFTDFEFGATIGFLINANFYLKPV